MGEDEGIGLGREYLVVVVIIVGSETRIVGNELETIVMEARREGGGEDLG
jgi:hypothetical protein